MKLRILADENIDSKIIKRLRSLNIDVYSITEESSGITDIEVIQTADAKRAVILTRDKGFGEMVFASSKRSNGVILLRYKPSDLNKIMDFLIGLIDDYRDKLYKKFVVITSRKIRIREI